MGLYFYSPGFRVAPLVCEPHVPHVAVVVVVDTWSKLSPGPTRTFNSPHVKIE
jgi:hypothetical protein